MKKFLGKLLAFSIVPLLIILTDLVLPLNTFTFREWEALQNHYPNYSYGSFYPNQEISMTEYGDLGRHTPYAIAKPTSWRTDRLGFRNDQYIADPDIVLIGDSFIAGSSLTQDQTLGNQLQHLLASSTVIPKYKVYNIAPEPFEKFDKLLRAGKIQTPALAIVAMSDRKLPMYIDRAVKLNILRYVSVKLNPVEIRKLFSKDADNSKEAQNRVNPRMLFYKDGEIINNDIPGVYDKILSVLSAYKSYCDKKGIDMLFVSLPDKETVYFDKISPLVKQPHFLMVLDSLVKRKNIATINALELFNNSRQDDAGKLLYQYDDTHWNANGAGIVAKALVKHIHSAAK
jgi:hypothetical protein